MSKKSEELEIYELANRWNAHHEPAIGTTCTASVGVVPKARHNVVSLSYSLVNLTAAAITQPLSIRDASIAGTVLCKFNVLQAANTGSQQCFANLELPGIMSNDVFVEFGTPGASITQTVAMCGWTENERSG